MQMARMFFDEIGENRQKQGHENYLRIADYRGFSHTAVDNFFPE